MVEENLVDLVTVQASLLIEWDWWSNVNLWRSHGEKKSDVAVITRSIR